jgi:hypothetical protein
MSVHEDCDKTMTQALNSMRFLAAPDYTPPPARFRQKNTPGDKPGAQPEGIAAKSI